MRELVMVIADLFLGSGAQELLGQPGAGFADIPGFQIMGRFGDRQILPHGWRAWVSAHIGRPELAGAARAHVAGARLEGWSAPASGASWIATPVHLSAGLTRVHLHHGGLLHLAADELAGLAESFQQTFGSDGSTLVPLPCGELLLGTPGIGALATTEPARLAGGIVSQVLPESAAAAPLRRLMAECEMWLHGQPLNAARANRGALALTALWPWGAAGQGVPLQPRACAGLPAGFGRDAWLDGAWRLCGGACGESPVSLSEVLLDTGAAGALVVLRVAEELRNGGEDSVAGALMRLDERFVSPALRALAKGEFAAVWLILNDRCLRVRRTGRLRLWRRRRPGLTGFA